MRQSKIVENKMHCLKMSGIVPSGKRREFEQTFRFVSNHLSRNCLEFNLCADALVPNQYHFMALWATQESMDSFCTSNEFILLAGAYKTLGTLDQSETVEWTNVKQISIPEIRG
jgi:quinol monooxygenase YgiN